MHRLAMPALLSFLLSTPAWSHSGGATYVELQPARDASLLQFDLPLPETAAEMSLDVDGDAALRWGEVVDGLPAVRGKLQERLAVRTTMRPLRPCAAASAAPARIVRRETGLHLRLLLRYDCAGPLELDATAWLRELPDHGIYLTDRSMPGKVTLLAGRSVTARLGGASQASLSNVAWRFLRLGSEHLLTGYDHLAFLALLLLGIVRLRPGPDLTKRELLIEAARIVTAFTAAHSLTLALAVSGLLRLPAGPVEAAIAATIVLTAIAVLARIRPALGWPVALLFGLVHGLGFANLLAELLEGTALLAPLLSFNAGLELAQLLVVAIALPALMFLASRPRVASRVVPWTAAGLAVLGAGWLLQRV